MVTQRLSAYSVYTSSVTLECVFSLYELSDAEFVDVVGLTSLALVYRGKLVRLKCEMAANCRKRKALTLEERVRVVERSEKGEKAISIAKDLCVGKTQIQNIIRDKDSIKKKWESGECGSRKLMKMRKTAYTAVDEAVWNWFCDARKRNIPVTGKLIREKALMVAQELDECDEFLASNGWLHKWMERRNVHQSALSGERGDVDPKDIEDWVKRLPSLYDGNQMQCFSETALHC